MERSLPSVPGFAAGKDRGLTSTLRKAAALLALLLAACATPKGKVIHVREILEIQRVGPSGATLLTEAELQQSDDRDPTLHLALVRADGKRQPLAAATRDEAQAALAALLAGSALRDALPPSLRSDAPAPEALGPGPWPLPPPLETLELSLEQRRDPRYGPTWIASIRDGAFAHEAARYHLPSDGSIALVVLAPDLAAFRLRSGGGGLRVEDVATLPLQQAALGLYTARAKDALARGALDEARAALDRALVLEAEPSGELWFTAARLAARRGDRPALVHTYLERAIATDPTLFRMQARTSPDFETLRNNEDIQELIRPRPLPGTHRHQDTHPTDH